MDRPSILLLAGRESWADRVETWTDAFELVRCSTPEEIRVLLAGSRPWSALLVDGGHPAADRDLLATAARTGTKPVVVGPPQPGVDWAALGAHQLLGPQFTADELATVVSDPLAEAEALSVDGAVVAVTGPGGTGASTVAIALAQGLSSADCRVLLADFSRNAEQHVLHNVERDLAGIGDLAEAFRTSTPPPKELRELAAEVPSRGYRLLGGLRRAVGWASLRPRALEAALTGLSSAYDVVVCDVDADLEGQAEGGSFDVEERNALARTAVREASVAVVVGGPGMKGTHSLLRVLGELWAYGVAPGRTVVVLNRGDETTLGRVAGALETLKAQPARLLFIPEMHLEAELRDPLPLPSQIVEPLSDTVTPLLKASPRGPAQGPVRIAPGSLGVPGEKGYA